MPPPNKSTILLELDDDLSKAQTRWLTLADIIGKKYTIAYQQHQGLLEDMKNIRQAELQTYYAILSIVAVAISGGIAGGLMAPFVKSVATGFAKIALANALSTMARQGVQGATQMIVASDQKMPSSPYRPAAPDPLLFYLDMRVQMELAFSEIGDQIDAVTGSAKWDPRYDQWLLDAFRTSCTLLTDKPDFGYMQHLDSIQVIETATEVAMWVAWANVRDMDYWLQGYATLSGGPPTHASPQAMAAYVGYEQDAHRLDLILKRLAGLLGDDSKVILQYDGGKVLDLRKLQKLDMSPLAVFRAMPSVNMEPLKGGASLAFVTPQQSSLRPLYKR